MKTLEVVCAVIHKGHKIFIAQRGYGKCKDGWEFPGGKQESDETLEEALHREIEEELHARIHIEQYLGRFEMPYPSFYMHMHAYLCSLQSEYALLEHEDARWLSVQDVCMEDLLPIDQVIFKSIEHLDL